VRHSGNCVLGHGLVEDLKKLAQRDLVHAVDKTHLTDQEVENAASCRYYTHVHIKCTLHTSSCFFV